MANILLGDALREKRRTGFGSPVRARVRRTGGEARAPQGSKLRSTAIRSSMSQGCYENRATSIARWCRRYLGMDVLPHRASAQSDWSSARV